MSKFLTFITKDELLKGDISAITDVIILSRRQGQKNNTDISKNIQADINLQGKMALSFADDPTDNREIFEIPQSKLFFQKLIKECPYILYFLDNQSILLLLSCLFVNKVENIDNIGLTPTLDMIKLSEFMINSIDNTNSWIEIKEHLQVFEFRIDEFIKSLFENNQLI